MEVDVSTPIVMTKREFAEAQEAARKYRHTSSRMTMRLMQAIKQRHPRADKRLANSA